MKFKILDRFEKPAYNAKSRAYLIWDNWNDYSFYTLFGLLYVDENSVKHEIGSIKIGFFGQKELEKKLAVGDTFESLDPDNFSLGQSDSYYLNLNELGDAIRDEILLALKDIAKTTELYERAIEEKVTKVSLLRSISPTSVTGQFRRLAMGLARLTSYSFQFSTPRIKGKSNKMNISFDVFPDSSPPSNIHVAIGRNGVGKTHLMNNMINSLIGEEPDRLNKYGEFIPQVTENGEILFANLISVSFSAFDESEPKPERKDKTEGIQYSYIGLKRIQSSSDKNLGPKSTIMLRNEFFKSLERCKTNRKIIRCKGGKTIRPKRNILKIGRKMAIVADFRGYWV
jgi:hypothetical protein